MVPVLQLDALRETARREKLKATVAALQKRVENLDAQDRKPASAA
jgi:hypothetical protein